MIRLIDKINFYSTAAMEWLKEIHPKHSYFADYVTENEGKIEKTIPVDEFREEVDLNLDIVYEKESHKIEELLLERLTKHFNILKNHSNSSIYDRYNYYVVWKALRNASSFINLTFPKLTFIFYKKSKKEVPENINFANENEVEKYIKHHIFEDKEINFGSNFYFNRTYNNLSLDKLLTLLRIDGSDIYDEDIDSDDDNSVKDYINEYSNLQRISGLKDRKYYIVFSKKLEDIACMSSRSEWTNCQSFDSEDFEYNTKLINAMNNPNVGVIYLTDASNYKNRGEKMLARSLVIFGKSKEVDALYITKPYSSHGALSMMALNLFKSILKSKSNYNVYDRRNYTNPVDLSGDAPYIDEGELVSVTPGSSSLTKELDSGEISTKTLELINKTYGIGDKGKLIKMYPYLYYKLDLGNNIDNIKKFQADLIIGLEKSGRLDDLFKYISVKDILPYSLFWLYKGTPKLFNDLSVDDLILLIYKIFENDSSNRDVLIINIIDYIMNNKSIQSNDKLVKAIISMAHDQDIDLKKLHPKFYQEFML